MSTNGSTSISHHHLLPLEPDMTLQQIAAAIHSAVSHSRQPIILILPERGIQALRRPDDFVFFKRLKRQVNVPFFFVIPNSGTLRSAAHRYGFHASPSLEELTTGVMHASGPLSLPLLSSPVDKLKTEAGSLPSDGSPRTTDPLNASQHPSLSASPDGSFWEFVSGNLPVVQSEAKARQNFIIQQTIEGETLETSLARLGHPLEEREALRLCSDLLSLLIKREEHIPPLPHGNITPTSIILEAGMKKVHLLDHATASSSTDEDTYSEVDGGYAAPEREGNGPQIRSDLYSAAAILYFLLTNNDPHSHQPYVYLPIRQLEPEISRETERFLTCALAYDPALRYQHAHDMKRDLDQLLTRLEYVASPPTMTSLSNQIASHQQKVPEPAARQPTSVSSRAHKKSQAHSNLPLKHMESDRMPPATHPSSTEKPWYIRFQKRLLVSLTIVLVFLVVTLGIVLPFLRQGGQHPQSSLTSTIPQGIGISRAANGQTIGLSDGSYSFDVETDRKDRALKIQASEKFRKHDVGSALTLWSSAVQIDSNDAESLIYLENQRVLSSGYPWVTIVVASMCSGTYVGKGRDAMQGAYVAQKEYNDALKLRGGIQIRLLIASTADDRDQATPVAQQIVEAAKKDPTIIGVMGWPYSSRVLNAVKPLTDAHIPLVSQMASSVELSHISPYFFRIVPPDTYQAMAGAHFAENTLHVKAAALFIDPSEAYSASLGNSFKQKFEADGNKIVVTEQYTVNKPQTLPAQLQDALKQNPDVIYFAGLSPDANTLLASLPTTGPFATIKVLGGDGLYEGFGFTAAARVNFPRIRFSAFAYPDEWGAQGLGQYQPKFIQEFAAAYDPFHQHSATPYSYTRPDGDTILAYDTTTVMLEAANIVLESKQKITPIDLRQALTMINSERPFQGFSGQIAFGPDGNPINKAVVILSVSVDSHIQMMGIEGKFLKSNFNASGAGTS